MTIEKPKNKLDKYVRLRGSIAHRAQGATTVKKTDVIRRLAEKTGEAVNSHVTAITKKQLGD
jgi:hypothetical protein